MIRLLPLAILAALSFGAPAWAVNLEYECGFNERIDSGRVTGSYKAGADGQIRSGQARWVFEGGPGREDASVTAHLEWHEGRLKATYVQIDQAVTALPKVDTWIRVTPSAGRPLTRPFIERRFRRLWSRYEASGYGGNAASEDPAFTGAFWQSEWIVVTVWDRNGAVLVHRSYALPARTALEALAVQFAKLDLALQKRDFSQCSQEDLDDPVTVDEVI